MNPAVERTDEYRDVGPVFESMASLDRRDPRYRVLRDSVITRCLPLADHIARRFDGRGEFHDDLVQVARVGLVNAVNRYDSRVGSDFVAFAVPTMMGEVRRHFRDTGWAVRVPRRVKELHLELGRAVSVLSQRLGRPPTHHELAAELRIGEDAVADGLLAGNAYQTVSVDAGTVGRRHDHPLAETLGADDRRLEAVENHETLRPILAALPDRERRILLLRFFANLTQSRIAEEIGVSQMHVSRLLARSLATLRCQLEDQIES
ncbi:SigB/SigF/SigG family RNA polymerase sigma factor [Rhodococcus sp. TAF43]|uniref:SigB/SigF/SigG family RNA polymerase sigma factor n=1 Tax=unclassified Rhodococcus (in: high G+C Gram-positive bacteria) TaxID=192944 RepID=UPI0026715742|nr:SigB/SigF/SigG family RNA polymerase sigma factor [Rhodococcus sp. W8901]